MLYCGNTVDAEDLSHHLSFGLWQEPTHVRSYLHNTHAVDGYMIAQEGKKATRRRVIKHIRQPEKKFLRPGSHRGDEISIPGFVPSFGGRCGPCHLVAYACGCVRLTGEERGRD